MGKLEFFSLLNSELYEKYNKVFPDNELKCLDEQYGRFFDILRLKNELHVLYSSEDFKNKPIFEIIKFMNLNKLDLELKEEYKLATLIATIPSTTASAERSFSALKRIKTYCRSTQGQDRLSSLAILSIEKIILDDLKMNPEFYDNVDDAAYYIPNFITEEQETYIMNKVNSVPKPKWCQLKNRRLQNWGGIPHAKGLIPEIIPDWLKGFVDRVDSLQVFPRTNRPNHVLINEYLPGQGIMPHLDGSLFFPTISTINCGSHTVLNFYNPLKTDIEVVSSEKVYSLLLQRRSLLILKDKMYTEYMHGIEEVTNDIIDHKISNITFCGSKVQNGIALTRNKRISLTIRNVPRVSKLNLNLLMIKK
ncbi:hypothetical protein QTP88_026680 [Uroleucon formosanum]